MLYTVPDYYKEFQCIADKCEDTCCAGWQIVIDKDTLKKYKKIKGDFRKRLNQSIHWFQGTFKQDSDKRCAFLNEKNLCDLYLNQGEKGFCKTCREYPRHTEEFEGVREITLSISCPEVARILMNRKEPVRFLSYEKEGEEEYEDFDPFLFSILEEARKEMIGILQNRKITVKDRILLILGMAHDMQGRMNRQEMFSCFEVIKKYTTSQALNYVKSYSEKEKEMEFSYRMFQHLYSLEFLKEDWGILLKETQDLLYQNRDTYETGKKEFQKYGEALQQEEIEVSLEQLLVYFLFSYFPGAVYDGEIYAKVQMAVYCVWMIWEIWMARWLKNEKNLELEERIELVYRFSREVEHSEQNLKTIERIMEKKWFLSGKNTGKDSVEV